MNSRKKSYLIQKLVALLLTIGIFATLFYYSTLRTPEKPNLQSRIDWKLVTTDKRMALTDEVKGILSRSISNFYDSQPVYINFWANWCLPCLEEVPILQELHAEFKDIPFVLQNIDEEPEQKKSAIKFAKQFNTLQFDFKNGLKLKKEFNMSAVPMHLFLDKNKNIAGFFVGDMMSKKEDFKNLLLQLKAEQFLE